MPAVSRRGLLIAVLVAALVALATMSRLEEVHRSGFEWTPGLITVIVVILAITGRPLAWGISFGLGAVGACIQTVYALGDLGEPARLAVAAVAAIVVLALWGLKPAEAASPRNQG